MYLLTSDLTADIGDRTIFYLVDIFPGIEPPDWGIIPKYEEILDKTSWSYYYVSESNFSRLKKEGHIKER